MSEHLVTKRHITYAAASQIIGAGLAKAKELGVNAAIVITEGSGEIVAVASTEATNPRGWRGGLAKATVSAGLGVSTEFFLDKRLKQDEVLWRALSNSPDRMFVPGGIPLKFEGDTVGAVGVSGGHYEQDAEVAQAVADAFEALMTES
ncbi:GlcG/HbpS family heme-binding protein [Candidatus Poriferisocius sp.]|uniref:GlcG/HbpS family heme-binding protein n=1 Tax=Candidatus Poriferisocius sp. TaxID=3101276 RepID=UPI003B5CEC4E